MTPSAAYLFGERWMLIWFVSRGVVCLGSVEYGPFSFVFTESPFSNPQRGQHQHHDDDIDGQRQDTPIRRRGYCTLLNSFRSIQSVEHRRHSHLRGPRDTPAQRQRQQHLPDMAPSSPFQTQFSQPGTYCRVARSVSSRDDVVWHLRDV
jgi:hypothetical protein